MKEEALKLADVGTPDSELAIHKIMIRNLVEELDKKTKPLSDDEIKQIYEKIYKEGHDNQVLALARAIEERHGIKSAEVLK